MYAILALSQADDDDSDGDNPMISNKDDSDGMEWESEMDNDLVRKAEEQKSYS